MDRELSLIGLATKAGKTVSGEFATEKSVRERRASVVIVACDASANTKKSFKNLCEYYGVPLKIAGTKEKLGRVFGHPQRACAAVTDAGFAGAIIKQLKESEEIGGN